MKCIGFWKENLKSYLITYDDLDPLSKYRCWVYQRADLNRILMSQAVGAFCSLNQEVSSTNYTEGAVVSLDLIEYERERDQCPLHFDDGENPWAANQENTFKIFGWIIYRSGALTAGVNVSLLLISAFVAIRILGL